MKTSFVIPTYNHWELTHQLLFDIYNTCRNVDEVLVINNGSTDSECFTGIQWWLESGMLPITDLIIQRNVGFLKACNFGVKESRGELIILVSNDVRIRKDILTSIIGHMTANKGRCIVGGVLYENSTGWNEFNGRIFPYLEGWLLAFTKKAWEEIGGFDVRYAPNDFEDVDFSTTAIDKGYALIGLDSSAAYHMGSQTIGYSPEREAITKANREKFKEKWIK